MNRALLHKAEYELDLGRSLLPTALNKRPHGAALLATGYSRQQADQPPKPSWAPLQLQPPNLDTVKEWLRFADTRLGIVTGPVSRIVIVDGDKGPGIEKFLAWGIIPRCHVQTVSGGLHYYLQHPGWKVRTVQTHTPSSLELMAGVDIRGDGGYAMLPPSVLHAGRYITLRDSAYLDSPEYLPPEIQALMHLDAPPSPPVPRADVHDNVAQWGASLPIQNGSSAFERLEEGQRWTAKDGTSLDTELVYRALAGAHHGASREGQGFWLAKQLRDNNFAKEEAWAVMLRYQAQAPPISAKGVADPYTTEQARISLDSAFRKPPRSAWGRLKIPQPKSLSVQLDELWPHLNDLERQEAIQFACGMRGSERANTMEVLKNHGIDPEPQLQRIKHNIQQGHAVKGTASLQRLLNKAQQRLCKTQKTNEKSIL